MNRVSNFEIDDDQYVAAVELADAVVEIAGGQVPCQADPDGWYPPRNGDDMGSAMKLHTQMAKDLCNTQCELVLWCRAYALKHHENDGVWGGTTYFDRKQIWKQMNQGPKSRKGIPNKKR